jgi:hypothetical protein
MARRRSALTFLTLAAGSAGLIALTAGSSAQNVNAPVEVKADTAKPCPPPPSSAIDTSKPDGERRDSKTDRGGDRNGGDGKGRREWRGGRKWENLTPEQMQERALRDLEKLTPEQRAEVWRAVWAVLNLPQEKKQEIIGMDEERRKKMREEIDRTIQAIGVKIPDDQRRKFFHRYFMGRRELEEQVKKEGEERRQVLMKDLDEKLKQEFGNTQLQVEQKLEQK